MYYNHNFAEFLQSTNDKEMSNFPIDILPSLQNNVSSKN